MYVLNKEQKGTMCVQQDYKSMVALLLHKKVALRSKCCVYVCVFMWVWFNLSCMAFRQYIWWQCWYGWSPNMKNCGFGWTSLQLQFFQREFCELTSIARIAFCFELMGHWPCLKLLGLCYVMSPAPKSLVWIWCSLSYFTSPLKNVASSASLWRLKVWALNRISDSLWKLQCNIMCKLMCNIFNNCGPKQVQFPKAPEHISVSTKRTHIRILL